jgi:glutathione S-transferase
LLPTEPYDRAQVETWMDWQASELNAAWRYAFLALIRKEPGHDDPAQIERSLKACAARLALIDRRLAQTRAFIAGFEFTLADINLALSIHRIRALPGAPRLPREVAVYFDRLGPRPAFARWCDPATP